MDQTSPVPVYDSSKRTFQPVEELREALRYRHAIIQFIRRDAVSKFKRSSLGVAWTVLSPLGMMLVRVIVFATVFGRDPGYPVYVYSGLLVFAFFSEVTNRTIRDLIWGGGLLNRIYIPRSVFVISAVGGALITLSVSMVTLLGVTLVVGLPITPAILFLPFALILLIAFSVGTGLLLSLASLRIPDIAEAFKVVLRAWLYLTPIVYPESILYPKVLLMIKIFNPMYYLVNVFRIPVYEGRVPTAEEIIPAIIFSLAVFIPGWIIFTYRSDEFAYRA